VFTREKRPLLMRTLLIVGFTALLLGFSCGTETVRDVVVTVEVPTILEVEVPIEVTRVVAGERPVDVVPAATERFLMAMALWHIRWESARSPGEFEDLVQELSQVTDLMPDDISEEFFYYSAVYMDTHTVATLVDNNLAMGSLNLAIRLGTEDGWSGPCGHSDSSILSKELSREISLESMECITSDYAGSSVDRVRAQAEFGWLEPYIDVLLDR
jgi:hypothetical protein